MGQEHCHIQVIEASIGELKIRHTAIKFTLPLNALLVTLDWFANPGVNNMLTLSALVCGPLITG